MNPQAFHHQSLLQIDDHSDSDSDDADFDLALSPRAKLRREFEKESKRERKLTQVLEKNVKFCEKTIGRTKLEEILKHLLNVV